MGCRLFLVACFFDTGKALRYSDYLPFGGATNMNALLVSGWTRLEIGPRRDRATAPAGEDDAVAIASIDQARQYLNRYAAAPAAMARLRALAAARHADISRQSDDEVLQWMARALRDGLYQLNESRLTPLPGRAPGTDMADVPAAPAPPQRSAVREQPASPPPARVGTLPAPTPAAAPADNELDSVDHDAQAATLVAAARDGTPFCAVCERERQRRLTA